MHDEDVPRANSRGHFRETFALTLLGVFTLCRADRADRFEATTDPIWACCQRAARRTGGVAGTWGPVERQQIDGGAIFGRLRLSFQVKIFSFKVKTFSFEVNIFGNLEKFC